ncbi:hypothetical protein UR09_06195 [Candidatus Nitromaritima sp. SCGC AAA799-A02]|nr:hypothetical protein UR09_06195 [Candidatus Nitromaritima sp. SCGC AAA799-A02]KMP11749.1 hypothetical protein UZ36_03205 [Candidatus Nitromaritima sp. SCGC AAA799-C22]
MTQESRFKDNGDGTITDTKNNLTWTREDSWQMDAKWVTWDEADDHARNLANIKFAGHNDWRLPSTVEAKTLYDPQMENKDKYGTRLYLDPVFPEGSLPTIWIHEPNSGNDGFILDLRDGDVRTLYKSKSGRMAVRAVRKNDDQEPNG